MADDIVKNIMRHHPKVEKVEQVSKSFVSEGSNEID